MSSTPDYEIEEFTKNHDMLLMAGIDEEDGSYAIQFCTETNVDELTDVLCYIIKTAIGTMDNAENINEAAEMEIFRLLEQKLIEDDSKYVQED